MARDPRAIVEMFITQLDSPLGGREYATHFSFCISVCVPEAGILPLSMLTVLNFRRNKETHEYSAAGFAGQTSFRTSRPLGTTIGTSTLTSL
jgi:hypothetical protein